LSQIAVSSPRLACPKPSINSAAVDSRAAGGDPLLPVMPFRSLPARRPFLALLALGPALAGCTVTPSAPRPGSAPSASEIRQPSRSGTRDPRFQSIPGLEGVIGVTERELVRQFGRPRLEVWEGDARKLQFTGRACLLDVYLYPTSRTSDRVATWVDARRSSDGREVDRAACVAALRQR
jgi:hypothetical protein